MRRVSMILMTNGNVSFISRYAVEIMKNDRVNLVLTVPLYFGIYK